MEDDSPALSSSFRARDDVFCHETARRAVARAALHLGLDSMSVEACDSLAAVLIAYLERVGRAVATTVEASGRSSAHANLLDALRAIEVCTEPAVTAVFSENAAAVPQTTEATPADPDRHNHSEQMSWKGLAAFCFGKQWREPLDQDAAAAAAPRNRGRGGKVTGGEEETEVASGDDNNTAEEVAHSGWRAPYPEEVVPFPVASPTVANPHNLPEDLLQLEEMPDKLFASNGDRKRERDEEEDAETEPPAKKAKASDEAADVKPSAVDKKQGAASKKDDIDTMAEAAAKAATEAAAEAASSVEEDKHRPWYFPKHWPSYPHKEVGTQALVLEDDPLGTVGDEEIDDILEEIEGNPVAKKSGEAEADPTRSVRSALVQMGWGTIRDTTGTTDPYELRVVPGARLDAAAAGGAKGQIVPLGKASIARVNRILEGSMEGGM